MKKNLKKILLLTTVVVLAVICFAVSASALDATGQCGDNVSYTYNSTTDELIISGEGPMTDYENYNDSPFYYSNIKSVVINNGVTTIGDGAFYWCESLTEVTIPDSVTTIGDYAFRYCYSLTEVTIPDSVTTIGDYAFCGCFSLTEVTIGDSVTTIGDYAFFACNSLTEVTIGNSVKTIGDHAFDCCYDLKKVTIPDSVTTIGDGAFLSCYSLKEVTIGDSVTTIGSEAFYECYSLTEVTIPDSVTTIGDFAFYFCDSLTEVTIPDSVTTIGDSAFYECYSLTDVYYGGTQEQWKKISIGSLNDSLTDANIHFNYVSGSITKPSSITPVQSASAIKLTWPAVPDSVGYRVYQKVNNDWKALGNVTKTSATLTKLTAGTKYTYAVQAIFRVNGALTLADDYTTITTATKTAKPAKVAAAQNTSAIKLAWTKVTGADGYRIYYKSGNTWKVCVNSTTATSHTFKNLKAGAKYIFAVQPYIKTSSGVVWGEYAEFMTATKPAVPASKVTSPSKGRISLAFGAVNGADGYQVWYKTGNGAYKLYKTYGKTGTINFSNLKSGTKYTFAVRAGIKTSGGNIYGGYKEVAVTVK